MPHRIFVTGTDTGVGKTEIATTFLYLAKQKGFSTAAMKPVSAGCTLSSDENGNAILKNEDAIRLHQLCTTPLSYAELNPVALEEAIAPHIAAAREKRNINAERLLGLTQNIFLKKADFTVIEGAGGWQVPLNHREMFSQYVKQLKIPVVLVVGMRLGCLNHSLLTAESILRNQIPLAGWVANCIDAEMPALDENIATLKQQLPAPCLGVIPFQQDISTEKVASYLDFHRLVQQLESDA